MVRGDTDKNFKPLHDKIKNGLKLGQELIKKKRSKKEKKQEWAIEKPKLENAISLRELYSIDPRDEEHKHIVKNGRRKLETPIATAMPCKRTSAQASVLKMENLKHPKRKQVSVVLKKHESTRQKIESVTKRSHEDHIAGKGRNSVLHCNLAHK